MRPVYKPTRALLAASLIGMAGGACTSSGGRAGSSAGCATATAPASPAPSSTASPTTASSLTDASGLYIYDGTAIPSSTFPTVGALFFSDGTTEGMCTANLLCSNVVLTAAHCFEGMTIGPSSYFFTRSDTVPFTQSPDDIKNLPSDATAGSDVQIDPLRATSDKTVTRGPDLAFLRLTQPFPAPYAQLTFTALPDPLDAQDGVPGEAIGYGESTQAGTGVGTKRDGDVTFVGTNAGDPGTVFAERGASGQDSCDGDSGGPLMIDGSVYGVLSGGDSANCGDQSVQGLSYYASVPNSAAWLQSVISSWCGDAPVATVAPGGNQSSASAAIPGDTEPCTVH